VKRLFDLLVAFVLAPIWAPLLALVALLVRWRLGSPVLFRQRRPGLGGRAFTILKFRTMVEAYGADGQPLCDTMRVTPFGQFLRSTSLDELPSILNLVRGDLSLVGPRPLLMEYLPLYTPEQSRRHLVRPGITGWAQVNGRNALEWEDKFALDTWYVDNRSFWLDLRILALTAVKVLRRDGIRAEGSPSATRFTGRGG
jgi:sugar transferase EpsL